MDLANRYLNAGSHGLYHNTHSGPYHLQQGHHNPHNTEGLFPSPIEMLEDWWESNKHVIPPALRAQIMEEVLRFIVLPEVGDVTGLDLRIETIKNTVEQYRGLIEELAGLVARVATHVWRNVFPPQGSDYTMNTSSGVYPGGANSTGKKGYGTYPGGANSTTQKGYGTCYPGRANSTGQTGYGTYPGGANSTGQTGYGTYPGGANSTGQTGYGNTCAPPRIMAPAGKGCNKIKKKLLPHAGVGGSTGNCYPQTGYGNTSVSRTGKSPLRTMERHHHSEYYSSSSSSSASDNDDGYDRIGSYVDYGDAWGT